MVFLAVTSTKNIHLIQNIEQLFFITIIFTQSFSKVIQFLDLLKRRPELTPGLANFDVAPFMSIKLCPEYESTHMLLEVCYMELK